MPCFMLHHLVPSSNAQIDTAFTNEGRDVCGREEDKADRMVLYEGDVEARGAVEGDVGAGKEVESVLLQAALFWHGEQKSTFEICLLIDEVHFESVPTPAPM